MNNTKPQNLIFIMSDQHNKEMTGCYGNDIIKTPNIDRIAKEGVRFDNAYCSCPLCVPSRSSFVTGMMPHEGGFWDNAQAFGGGYESFGSQLYDQGYNVTAIGKMHLESDTPETGFHDQRIPLHMVNGKGDIYGCIRNDKVARPQFRNSLEKAGPGMSDYIRYDREIAQRAISYIKNESKNSDKPFVLYLGFVSPHFPLNAPKEYFDLYDIDDIELPSQFDKSQWPNHPVLETYRKYCNTEDISEEVAKKALHAYYAMCSFLDEQIGKVLDALDNSDVVDSTRVIYTSDHGDTMGNHGVFFKSTMYEGSVSIPLVMKGAGISPNTKVEAPVSLLDMYPTILECVGAKDTDKSIKRHGVSLFETIANPDYNRSIISEYHAFGINVGEFMLRKGDYKYIYYTEGEPMLFDIKNDPNENVDLSLVSEYNTIKNKLAEELYSLINPDEISKQAFLSQEKVLNEYGGEEGFLQNFKPLVFSPIPRGI
jgi:choline-sulfatase